MNHLDDESGTFTCDENLVSGIYERFAIGVIMIALFRLMNMNFKLIYG